MTQPSSDSHSLTAREAAEVVRLRRDDVAALAESSRLRARATPWVGAAPPTAGLLAFFTMISAQELAGITALTTPLCVITGVVVSISVAARAWYNERTRRAAYAWACPACGVDIVSSRPFADDSAQAALVVATGHCPACGERIVAD